MKSAKLIRRWRKRRDQLARALRREWKECRRTGEEEAVHRLRVVLRRSRLYIRVGSPLTGKVKAKKYSQWARQASDNLAWVRDLDMALLWIRKHPETQGLGSLVAVQRQQAWKIAKSKFRRLHSVPGEKRDKGSPSPIGWERAGVRVSRVHGHRLKKRFSRSLLEARHEIEAFHSPLSTCPTEVWHGLRRALRRVRYLRELVLSSKQAQKDKLLKALVVLQEELGEAQNLNAVSLVFGRLKRIPDIQVLQGMLREECRKWLDKGHASLLRLKRSDAWAKSLASCD
jgi:CHAD domain-containing protein